MTGCKYFDCGFCYAPLGVENNAHTGECNEPLFCPYLISKMTEKEKIEGEIKILQKKLSLLEELSKTKTPVEEGYKKVFGYYPVTDIGDAYWEYFQKGYKSAQEDYKVGEFQEPEEKLKTLFQMLNDKNNHPETCAFVCNIVKRWMSQYTHNVMTGEYLKGYEECLTVLKENLE